MYLLQTETPFQGICSHTEPNLKAQQLHHEIRMIEFSYLNLILAMNRETCFDLRAFTFSDQEALFFIVKHFLICFVFEPHWGMLWT